MQFRYILHNHVKIGWVFWVLSKKPCLYFIQLLHSNCFFFVGCAATDSLGMSIVSEIISTSSCYGSESFTKSAIILQMHIMPCEAAMHVQSWLSVTVFTTLLSSSTTNSSPCSRYSVAVNICWACLFLPASTSMSLSFTTLCATCMCLHIPENMENQSINVHSHW